MLRALPEGALARLRAMPATEVARRLPVYPADILGDGGRVVAPAFLQPVAGRHAVDAESVRFVPRFPFLAGRGYAMLVHRSLAGEVEATGFDVDDFEAVVAVRPSSAGRPSTRVVAIAPSAEQIPRNMLRFYVHFSAPMSEGFAATHVRIVDAASARPIDDAFLSMDPELWDPGRQRLTLLLDPARIKRGLVPHQERSYALRVGASVVLEVDPGFLDAEGLPLVDGASRPYAVGGDVRARVDPAAWRVVLPGPGTTGPLTVEFDRPLDRAQLGHCLSVVDADGRVRGLATVKPCEMGWAFVPDAPWRRGTYRLVVDPLLEDLAGNSVRRVFDRALGDTAEPGDRPAAAELVLDVGATGGEASCLG